jgi:hypothetical protein
MANFLYWLGSEPRLKPEALPSALRALRHVAGLRVRPRQMRAS